MWFCKMSQLGSEAPCLIGVVALGARRFALTHWASRRNVASRCSSHVMTLEGLCHNHGKALQGSWLYRLPALVNLYQFVPFVSWSRACSLGVLIEQLPRVLSEFFPPFLGTQLIGVEEDFMSTARYCCRPPWPRLGEDRRVFRAFLLSRVF